MILNALCLSLLLLSNEPPSHRLVLKNGHRIQILEPYQVVGRLVRFRDLRGTYLSLPGDMVDFKKTHGEQKAKPDPTREDEDAPLREIPWDHPLFKDKTFSIKEIIIDDQNLNHFSKRRASSPEDGETRDPSAKAQTENRPPVRGENQSSKSSAVGKQPGDHYLGKIRPRNIAARPAKKNPRIKKQ